MADAPPPPASTETPDPHAARKEELVKLRKSELADLILELEARSPAAPAEANQPVNPLAAELEATKKTIAAHVQSGSTKDERINALEAEVKELNTANTSFDQAYQRQVGEIEALKSHAKWERIANLFLITLAIVFSLTALLKKGVTKDELYEELRKSEKEERASTNRQLENLRKELKRE